MEIIIENNLRKLSFKRSYLINKYIILGGYFEYPLTLHFLSFITTTIIIITIFYNIRKLNLYSL